MNKSVNDSASRNPHQRVVITGMGAITPVGHTVAETWESLKAGRSGVRRITSFDATPWSCQIAGELTGFDPLQFIPPKKARNMAVASQIAVIATGQALEDAGLDLEQEDRDRIGVLIGTAGGSSIEETERITMQLMDRGSGRLSPFQVVRLWPNMASYFVAEAYQVRGHNGTVCTACAAATQAIGDATEVIRRGAAEVMITGGTESMISQTMLAGFVAMRALPTSYNDEPERAMRPFDADREGFVGAQGSAMLILESLAHAQARGARIHAEVLGAGVSNDAFHMIAPDPEGSGAALAIRRALADAGVEPEAVGYINAHAASTPLGDLAETKAIKAVYGKHAYEIPISSTKSMIGHMMGATGAVEAMACVMSIQEGIIHPTINYETPDPECDLDYVPNEARRAEVKVAVSNSFGLGGQNAVLVLGAMV
ncbi:MAG: beta-ketoacyl-ACP synthase II [Anaerolineales bacterium]|nr:beta-ketoacyl-ACP synthase II [Anaerolineales bacterium]